MATKSKLLSVCPFVEFLLKKGELMEMLRNINTNRNMCVISSKEWLLQEEKITGHTTLFLLICSLYESVSRSESCVYCEKYKYEYSCNGVLQNSMW